MEKVRVLIADDSVVYRSQIRSALEKISWVEVVGASSNGRLALEKIAQLPVDILILDLEMPEMDGIQTLLHMKEHGTKCDVLVFSSMSKRGSEITLEALRLGAKDFVTKPEASASGAGDPADFLRTILEPRLKVLADARATSGATATAHYSSLPTFISDSIADAGSPRNLIAESKFNPVIWDLFQPKLLVIGSSTGGPTALERLFALLPAPYTCPIVIAQHMPPIFTETFAQRLGKITGVRSKEVENGEELVSGSIYLAPGDFHARVRNSPGKMFLTLDQGPQINSVRPAVDPLFETASELFGSKLLALVLTGMGADGKVGALAVKKAGGVVLIQDKASSVVFGMPGAIFESGAYDFMGNIEEIADHLRSKICDRAYLKVSGN